MSIVLPHFSNSEIPKIRLSLSPFLQSLSRRRESSSPLSLSLALSLTSIFALYHPERSLAVHSLFVSLAAFFLAAFSLAAFSVGSLCIIGDVALRGDWSSLKFLKSSTELQAGLIAKNGVIFTSDRSMPFADSMAVRNGRILHVGNYSSIEELCRTSEQRVKS